MNLSIILLGDAAEYDSRFARDVLSGADWLVVEARNGASVFAQAQEHQPDLILLDPSLGGDAASAVAALRAAGKPLRNTPILAFARAEAAPVDLSLQGIDGHIAKPATAAALIAAVEPWRPAGDLAGAQRLIETFGEAAIAPMVARFGGQLADAVVGLGATVSADELHRVAGIAGTLGFGRLSASWQRLSQGDAAILPVARRDARRVLAEIDRDPRFAANEQAAAAEPSRRR